MDTLAAPLTVDSEILDYIKTLTKDHYVIIEYGLESCYNSTLTRVNRGHSFEDSLLAIDMTASRGIRQGAHFIIGLPGETDAEILAQAGIISELPIQNVKFHQLQIVKNTFMAREFEADPGGFRMYSLEEYLELMLQFIELLNPALVVERIAGEVNPGYLLSERFVLATGKNFTHRIYIGQGIYADLTLIYQRGAFEKLPWTYPDYADEPVLAFLEKVRIKYALDIKTK